MFAGNDITPVPEIIDQIKESLPRTPVKLSIVTQTVLSSYQAVRLKFAETKYLAPLNLTMTKFHRDGERILGKDFHLRLLQDISSHEFQIELLIAGFDSRGNGRIFSVDSTYERGVLQRHDMPGFYAIGSGSIAANHMMYYRELSPKMPARLALYLAYEAKYWGELASGVGIKTDLYVFRRGKAPAKLDDNVIEGILAEKLCKRLEPREITDSHLEIMNEINIPNLKKLQWPSRDKMKKEKYKSLLSLVKG